MTIKIKKSRRPVSVGALIRVIARTKNHPDSIFDRSLLSLKPKSGKEIYQEYIHCLHSRITAGRPLSQYFN